jgi:hypothetical protein
MRQPDNPKVLGKDAAAPPGQFLRCSQIEDSLCLPDSNAVEGRNRHRLVSGPRIILGFPDRTEFLAREALWDAAKHKTDFVLFCCVNIDPT